MWIPLGPTIAAGTREDSRNEGSERSSATTVPQKRCGGGRGDGLNLMQANAAGTATPVGIPGCCWGTWASRGAAGAHGSLRGQNDCVKPRQDYNL